MAVAMKLRHIDELEGAQTIAQEMAVRVLSCVSLKAPGAHQTERVILQINHAFLASLAHQIVVQDPPGDAGDDGQ